LQTYRHAIELLLKAGCLEIARLQRFTLKMGYGKATEPDDLESVLGNMHGIGELIEVLNNLMDGLDVDRETSKLPEEVQEALAFLHDADERGQAFRYGPSGFHASRRSGRRSVRRRLQSTWTAPSPVCTTRPRCSSAA